MSTNSERERIPRIGATVERFIFPEMPLTYQEMLMLVPADILKPKHPKHKKVVGLIQAMARHLEDARIVSKMPASQYSKGFSKEKEPAKVAFRITGIQQQMSAVRFRLDIHDYRGSLEKSILEDRLYRLYYQAKEIDPEGTARFERMIDKRMRKARRG